WRGKSPCEWQFMQRGWRKTDTNSTKRAPPVAAGVPEAVALAEGRSAALIGRETDIPTAKNRTATVKRTAVCECFIQPPSYGSAACGSASQSQRTQRSRRSEEHTSELQSR